MKQKIKWCVRMFAACSLAIVGPWVQGQTVAPVLPVPLNLVQLSSSASVEVPQDWLTLTLSTSRDGPDADTVQAQLKLALNAALTLARQRAQVGELEVNTGNFRLSPRFNREGRISGWQGSAELLLQGRDFTRIAALAGNIPSLTIGGVQFSLSRATQTRVEVEAQSMAIERFKAKAGEIAKSFGFSSYGLREVSVNANDQGFMPQPRMMAMQAKGAAADAAVQLEAGKSAVVVTVSGTVQLQ